MDLTRMLELCRRDQWSVSDLDWSRPPRAMSREDEIAIVQLFTDMAGIERLAGALFEEQERRVSDPTLKAIFRSFVVDEIRHSHVAERLAAHYDRGHYRVYRMNESLSRFVPHFLNAIGRLEDDVANAYITAGELILDIALLRSIDDFVHDETSAAAMRLVNRDESRHIAIDYFMIERYASPEYVATLASRPRKSARERAAAWWTFGWLLWYAQPFVRDVFLDPMAVVDPSGARLREAFKRYQQIGAKPGVASRPFSRFLAALQELYHHPIAGPLLGKVLVRLAGVSDEFIRRLNTEQEMREASVKSFDQLAEEALAIKRAS